MENRNPPRLQQLLMSLLSPRHMRAELLGDMHEEYNRIASQHSRSAASRWYRRQLWKSAGILVGRRVQAYRPELIALGAFLGYWTIYYCELAALKFLTGLSKSGVDSHFLANNLLLVLAMELFAFTAGGLMIGVISGLARASHRVRIVACLVLTGVFVVPTMINMFVYPDAVPVVLRVIVSILALPLITIGSVLGAKLTQWRFPA